MSFEYYETMLVLDVTMKNLDRLHRSLDKRIRDSFLGDNPDPVLRDQRGAVPNYRFYARSKGDNQTLCLIRSRVSLELPGERKMRFDWDGSEYQFKTFMCLNRKIGSKLTFDSNLETVGQTTIIPKLKNYRIDSVQSIDIGDYERGAIQKIGGKPFFFVGAMIEITCSNVTKEIAFDLYVDGLGIKSIYGYGLVF